ncbi:hypothetical protein PROVALCAL_00773 [Providencia alcalifaciens DSM 30120]|uniref:Uncharacterized protein n=1 Tax=Providencia alcalifaciens DSM 30120 TaxID=520999 RepID=B6XBR2_9GAMM|nr:hypothetical protein PROVALCAL_00773 [Providencia alcalifaciens DSM 30120]
MPPSVNQKHQNNRLNKKYLIDLSSKNYFPSYSLCEILKNIS